MSGKDKNMKTEVKQVLAVFVMFAAIASTIAARADESTLAAKPTAASVKDALQAVKAGKTVYNCKQVELVENKAGNGLSFKNVKRTKTVLTLSPSFIDLEKAMASDNVYNCKEAEVVLGANGLRFSNK